MNESFMNFLDNDTKKVCLATFISMFLILIFVLGPLSSFTMANTIAKILILVILFYSIYLNVKQTKVLNTMSREKNNTQYNAQLQLNIMCSYVFTLFLGVLCIFILKSFL
jgi:hypothetical protein